MTSGLFDVHVVHRQIGISSVQLERKVQGK